MKVWNVLVGVCDTFEAESPEDAERLLTERLRAAGFETFEGRVAGDLPDTFRALVRSA
jgi:hypothetical protein